ncbi:MAG: hypothetical protein ACREX8_21620, partial [Gammaproteobacteria bacterium]
RSVEGTATFTNMTNRIARVNRGQSVRLVLVRDGTVVSFQGPATLALVIVTLKPGESDTVSWVYRFRPCAGPKLPPGTYQLYATEHVGGADGPLTAISEPSTITLRQTGRPAGR